MMLVEDSPHNFSLFNFKSYISPMICIKSPSIIHMEIDDKKGQNISQTQEILSKMFMIYKQCYTFFQTLES